jgi:acetyltransferase-like isoleucine patch superfamily enzyme
MAFPWVLDVIAKSPLNASYAMACAVHQDPSREPTAASAFPIIKRIKPALKGLAIALGMVVVALPAFTCMIERLLGGRDALFLLWGQAFALAPGLPGSYIRKCFYFLTVSRCPLSGEIGFLSSIHDRRTEIGARVYVGSGVGIGWASIGDGCLIASRVSILSGGSQHQFDADGRLTPFDRASARRVQIGADSWIGEGTIIMADVGSRVIVGAGSIVTKPITSGCVVAGNPARLIRHVGDARDAEVAGHAD